MATTKTTASTKKDDAPVTDGAETETPKTKKSQRTLADKDVGVKPTAEEVAAQSLPPTDGKKGDTILLRNVKVNGSHMKAGAVLTDPDTIQLLEKQDGLTMKL